MPSFKHLGQRLTFQMVEQCKAVSAARIVWAVVNQRANRCGWHAEISRQRPEQRGFPVPGRDMALVWPARG